MSELMTIALARIRPSALNPRKSYDEAQLRELGESIVQAGLLEPLVVMPAGDPGAHDYELIAGERRWRAARLAGIEELPCIVRELSARDAAELMLVENLQRADLTPIEEANAFHAWIKTRATGEGDQRPNYPKELAAKIGKGEDYVRDRLRLLAYDAECQAAIGAGQLPIKAALTLLRIGDEGERLDLAQQVIRGELATGDLRRSLSVHVIDLTAAVWRLGAEFGGHPACEGCPSRVFRGGAVWLPETNGKRDLGCCTDRSCYLAKLRSHAELKLGATVVDDQNSLPKGWNALWNESWKKGCSGCADKLAYIVPATATLQRVCVDSGAHYGRREHDDDDVKAERRRHAAKLKARRDTHQAASAAAFTWLQAQTPAELARLAIVAVAMHGRQDQAAAVGKLLGLDLKRGEMPQAIVEEAKKARGERVARLLAAVVAGVECGESVSAWESGPDAASKFCKAHGIRVRRASGAGEYGGEPAVAANGTGRGAGVERGELAG